MTEQPDLESLPPAWVLCKVGEAGECSVGQSKVAASSDERLPYLRAANIEDQELDLSDVATMPFADPERHELQPGDVLLTEGSGSRSLVGRSALYRGQLTPLYIQNSVLRFRPRPGIHPEYALLVFRAYQKSGVFAKVARGSSGISHLGMGRFRDLNFPLPPLSVQHSIASTAQAIQENLDVIARTIEQASVALESVLREIRDVEILGKDHAPWTGGASGASPWPVFPAAEIVDQEAPIIYGITQPGADVADGVPYIRGQDLQEGSILIDQLRKTAPEIATRYFRSSLQAEDVLLGIIRNTRVAIVPQELDGANITQGTARLRPGPQVASRYLAHWLSSAAARGWLNARMRGIGMPRINLRDVRRMPIPLPDMSTQNRIATRLDSVVSEASILAEKLQRLSGELPQLEAELLQSAAYGELAARSSATALGKDQSPAQDLLDEIRSHASVTTSTGASPKGRKKHVSQIRGNLENVTAAEILAALEASASTPTPEDLFAKLKLAETAVDAFYSGLRELMQEQKVRVLRPDGVTVLLELAT